MAKKPLPRSDIQIKLNREELRRLVHMVYIATWVIGAYQREEEPPTATYDELEQKVYALAARHGFAGDTGNPAEDLLEYFEEPKKYFGTRYLDEGEAGEFVVEYDDDTFWEQLAYRLAERDVVQEVGGFEAYAALPTIERIERTARYEARYGEELDAHGLENVRIVRPLSSGHAVH